MKNSYFNQFSPQVFESYWHLSHKFMSVLLKGCSIPTIIDEVQWGTGPRYSAVNVLNEDCDWVSGGDSR